MSAYKVRHVAPTLDAIRETVDAVYAVENGQGATWYVYVFHEGPPACSCRRAVQETGYRCQHIDAAKSFAAVEAVLNAAGFRLECTGGNCTAFVRSAPDFEEIITVPDGARAPALLTDAVVVSSYAEGDLVEECHGYTLADVVAALSNPSEEYYLLTLRLQNHAS